MNARINWMLLGSAMLGSTLAGLSTRIFMISLPSMARGLETDILGISWALISFQLASISLSVVFGRVGDIYGRRTVYLMGFLTLAVSSFLCGMSQNIAQLIIFRFFQGVGGAMTQSVSRTLAMEAMPEGSEGKAQGLMTTAFHSGFFVGPPIGGFLVEYFNWRGIFFFLVPFALAGLALSSIRPKGSLVRGPSRVQGSLDYKGALLLIGCTVMLILLLDRKSAEFITAIQKAFLALVFAGTVWFFAVYERRVTSPIVNFALFKIRMFSCSVLSLLTLSVTRGFMSFLMPFYLQEILSISPLFVGFIYLVPPIFTVTLAPLTGHMTDKIGPRTPATLGVAVSIVVLLLGVILRVDSHWILPTLMLGIIGIGTAFFNTANQAALIGSVPSEYRGFANGMVHMTFGLGNVLGVALAGLLLTLAFQYFSGIPGAALDIANKPAFVASMNASYAFSVAIGILAFFSSVMRGGGKVTITRSAAN